MRTVSEHQEVAAVLGRLTLHDAPIGQAETEDVALRSVWYGIELHDHAHARDLRNVGEDRKSTRLNSSHVSISYAVFCLKKKKKQNTIYTPAIESIVAWLC